MNISAMAFSSATYPVSCNLSKLNHLFQNTDHSLKLDSAQELNPDHNASHNR